MVYANSDEVITLTKEVIGNIQDEATATATITKAINHAERKINSKLRKSGVKIPIVPADVGELEDNNPLLSLLEAGTLYAIGFVLDTGYSGTEPSATARTHRSDADDLVDAYIEIIREGYNKEDPENDFPVNIPVGSLVRRR